MNAITGLLLFDGRGVDAQVLGRMTAVMPGKAGPDDFTYLEGSVGLASRSVRPRVLSPFSGTDQAGPGSRFALVCDARFDAVPEVTDFSGPPGSPNAPAPEHVLNQAYERWGENAASQLLGDFSFAVWDARKGLLHCARDFAGVRPFFYSHVPGRYFAFASDLRSLLALDDVSDALDETRIAEHVVQLVADPDSTFYAHIRKLPAGHTLTVGNHSLEIRRYFAFDPDRELLLDSDEDYLETFSDVFRTAVSCRLDTIERLATTLSGGIDSTAITAVTADLLPDEDRRLLATYSAVFEDSPDCDERSFLLPLVRRWELSTRQIDGDDIHPLECLDELLPAVGGPFTAPNASMMWKVYEAIQGDGRTTVLSGHGGDETISRGFGRLKELARERSWRTLRRELQALSEGSGFIIPFLEHVRYGLSQQNSLSVGDRTALRALRCVTRITGRRNGTSLPVSGPSAWLSGSIRKELDLEQRLRQTREFSPRSAHSERERHYRVLTDPIQQTALETLGLIARVRGLELRFPFWDKRLVEFCLSLPAEQKLRNGYDRYILRQSMKNLIPEMTLWRRGKTGFGSNVSRAILNNDRTRLISWAQRVDIVADYVDVDYFRAVFGRIQAGNADFLEILAFQNILTLSHWLHRKN